MDASYKTPTDSRRHTHHTKIKPFLNKTNSTSKLKEKRNKEKIRQFKKLNQMSKLENRDHGPGSVRPTRCPSFGFLNGCWLQAVAAATTPSPTEVQKAKNKGKPKEKQQTVAANKTKDKLIV